MIISDIKKLSKESHKKVSVSCDFRVSSECKKTWIMQYRDAKKTLNRNNDKIICLNCSRQIKDSGRNNPNCKYKNMDDNFFHNIDNEHKAYILGYIAADGCCPKDVDCISISSKDNDIMHKIRNTIEPQLPITLQQSFIDTVETQYHLLISSKQMKNDVLRHLNLSDGKKSDKITLPELKDNLMRHFMRGYFDGDGHISNPINNKKRYPICGISSNSKKILSSIYEYCNINGYLGKTSLEYSHNNALDFLGFIYNNSTIYMDRKYYLYELWSNWTPSISGSGSYGELPQFIYNKCKKNAVAPYKKRTSDIGYDITIIDIVKDFGTTKLYGTGLKIKPEYGYYFDMVPRSSISKTGYILKNSVAIIDPTYIGELLVSLEKIDPNADDLELPLRIGQLIPRKAIRGKWIEGDEFSETERGDKGFGSTGR